MYASDDCGAAILSAAHRARVLAVHLFSAPKDPAMIAPFFDTALTIDEVGQKLGIGELSDLSVRLVAAAIRELSSEADTSQLDSVLSRLAVIADRVGQQGVTKTDGQSTEKHYARSTSRVPPTGHRWNGKL